MNTIYISHSRSYDFRNELYSVIRKKELYKKCTIIFPHEFSEQPYDVLDLFKANKCQLVLAEVTYPSTGQGIELGWAFDRKIPLVCIHKSGVTPSSSLQVLTEYFFPYSQADDLQNNPDTHIIHLI